MKYYTALTNDYKKQLLFLEELFNKELDNDRTCEIEISNEMNPFNTPKYFDLIFKISNMEFARISFESYAKADNHIQYESKEIEVDTYVNNIMINLPICFND